MLDVTTSAAKLRDATIALVATGRTVSARAVAEEAGVSLGLIRHHFGSMAGLQRAADDHVARLVRERKEAAIAAGGAVDVLGGLREVGEQRIMAYIAHRLAEGGPAIDAFVDRMADDAAAYIQESIDAGLLAPMADVAAAARMLTVYALGSLALHRHLERLLGIDLTNPDLASQPGATAYMRTQFDVFGSLFPESMVAHYRAQMED